MREREGTGRQERDEVSQDSGGRELAAEEKSVRNREKEIGSRRIVRSRTGSADRSAETALGSAEQ